MSKQLPGNTLVEYGTIIGLVVILSIAALTMLGKSTSNVISNDTSQLKSKQVDNMLNLSFGSNSKQGASGQMAIDPATGLPGIQITDSATSGVNTTSSEGTIIVTNTLTLAQQLQAETAKIKSPEAMAWANEITRLVYFMGGAEGSFERIPGLTITSVSGSDAQYTQAAALRDIYDYQALLQEKLSNPPASVKSNELLKVNKLATNALTQAQSYVELLESYMKGPGDKLQENSLARSDLNEDGARRLSSVPTYGELVNYQELQSTTTEVLATNTAANTPTVQTTLQSAAELNEATSASATTSSTSSATTSSTTAKSGSGSILSSLLNLLPN